MARYSPFAVKMPLNHNQPTNQARAMEVPFRGLEYLILTLFCPFSPKIVKIKPEIGNFKPKR